MRERIKNFVDQYSYSAVLLYFVIYVVWFSLLEEHVRIKYVMGSWFDSIIPFEEVFVIPYLLWFGFVACAIVFFLFHSREEFLRLCIFLFAGMTICLIIYTFFPNGERLRPYIFERQNIFVDLVKRIYTIDTPTNVCPSIHVLNSIGVCVGIFNSELLKGKNIVKSGALVLTILICLSTVFIKQHSVIDVIASCILSIPLLRSLSSQLESIKASRFCCNRGYSG
jgi:membrane-associated phospholipid phosphatase